MKNGKEAKWLHVVNHLQLLYVFDLLISTCSTVIPGTHQVLDWYLNR